MNDYRERATGTLREIEHGRYPQLAEGTMLAWSTWSKVVFSVAKMIRSFMWPLSERSSSAHRSSPSFDGAARQARSVFDWFAVAISTPQRGNEQVSMLPNFVSKSAHRFKGFWSIVSASPDFDL